MSGRDPSIHLRRSDLINVFRRVGLDHSKVDLIIKLSKPRRIKNRILQEGVVYTDNVGKFISILEALRLSMNHKRIVTIKRGDKNWKVCMGIADKIEAFAVDFDIESFEEACRYVVENSLKDMKVFRLNSINPDKYRDRMYIEKSYKVKEAKKALKYYLKKCGLSEHYNDFKTPKVFINFVYLCEQTDKVEEWIDAQFKGLEWTGEFPEPHNLHGENAAVRFAKQKGHDKKSKKKSISEISKSG